MRGHKQQTKQEPQELPQLVPPEAPPQPALTHPLFGLAKGAPGKWLAVRLEGGTVVSLTPKRGGLDVGEAKHFAAARVFEAFKAACLGRRA